MGLLQNLELPETEEIFFEENTDIDEQSGSREWEPMEEQPTKEQPEPDRAREYEELVAEIRKQNEIQAEQIRQILDAYGERLQRMLQELPEQCTRYAQEATQRHFFWQSRREKKSISAKERFIEKMKTAVFEEAQLVEIQAGQNSGLSYEDIICYADPAIPASNMRSIRITLTQNKEEKKGDRMI